MEAPSTVRQGYALTFAAMLTASMVRDMHATIVGAYVVPIVQTSNWTEVKDRPTQGPWPAVWFGMPLGVPLFDTRGNVFEGWMVEARYVVSLAADRTQAARDQAYNEMTQLAIRCFSRFVHEYVSADDPEFDGIALRLKVDEAPGVVFEPFTDDGPENLTGCSMRFVLRDEKPLDCSKEATLFPSLA